MDKRIIIGADDCGFTLKEAVKEHLLKNGYDVTDVGTLSLDEPVMYYEVGRRVAKEVADKKFERGLLFCGTGMGVNLVANKLFVHRNTINYRIHQIKEQLCLDLDIPENKLKYLFAFYICDCDNEQF